MIQKFFIDSTLPGLNDVISANRNSKYLGAKLKREAENVITGCLWLAQLKPVAGAVWMRYAWKEPNRRRDWDNVASARKFIQDALVAYGTLAGDGQRYIKGFSDQFDVDPDRPGCLVTIEEIDVER